MLDQTTVIKLIASRQLKTFDEQKQRKTDKAKEQIYGIEKLNRNVTNVSSQCSFCFSANIK